MRSELKPGLDYVPRVPEILIYAVLPEKRTLNLQGFFYELIKGKYFAVPVPNCYNSPGEKVK